MNSVFSFLFRGVFIFLPPVSGTSWTSHTRSGKKQLPCPDLEFLVLLAEVSPLLWPSRFSSVTWRPQRSLRPGFVVKISELIWIAVCPLLTEVNVVVTVKYLTGSWGWSRGKADVIWSPLLEQDIPLQFDELGTQAVQGCVALALVLVTFHASLLLSSVFFPCAKLILEFWFSSREPRSYGPNCDLTSKIYTLKF